MSFLVPAALAFAAIIPIILLFYFMRPKRQQRLVGSTLLWRQALQDLQASHPWQRLRITPLLLLQLLAAIIIVLVLVRPAIFTASPLSGNTIIVLQASASMQATDVAPSRFEEARRTVGELIDTLGPDTRLSLIAMARTPQLLIAQSNDKTQLRTALQNAQVTNQGADLTQALSLATSLATRQQNAQVLVIGDGHLLHPEEGLVTPFPVRYMHIGTDTANYALLALTSRVVQGKLNAFAQVANFSSETTALPVELYADGRLVGVQSTTLQPNGVGSVQWSSLPSTARFLQAKIVKQDAFAADHEAWSIVGSLQKGRVLLVTDGNSFLKAALRLQPNVILFETTPKKYQLDNSYDLTIFDGVVPPSLPTGALFFVNPPPGRYLFGTTGPEVKVSRVNAGNDTPNLLAEVNLSTIRALSNSHAIQPALWAQSIMVSPETPLLLAGEQNNRRIATLGFDLHDTDFGLQPSFPIFIHNMMSWFLPAPVAGDGQVRAGTPVTIQTWPGAQQVTVTGPDQKSVTVGPPFPVAPYATTNQTGLYQVTQRVQGKELSGAFTVNLFDPQQSRLAPARALPVLRSTDFNGPTNEVTRQLREIWPWIAAFLLLVLCLEWWLFSRGYRQPTGTVAFAQQHQPNAVSRWLQNQRFVTQTRTTLQRRYQRTRKQLLKATRQLRRR